MHGIKIKEWRSMKGPSIAPTPSSHTTHFPSTIDLVVHKGMEGRPLTLETPLDAYGSDHYPVLVTTLEHLTTVGKPPPGGIIY